MKVCLTVSKRSIVKFLKHNSETGTIARLPGCGRPLKITSTQVHMYTYNLFDCGLFAVTDAGVETQEINGMENEDVTNHQAMRCQMNLRVGCHHH